jgi:hypothetical protein
VAKWGVCALHTDAMQKSVVLEFAIKFNLSVDVDCKTKKNVFFLILFGIDRTTDKFVCT